VTATPKRRWYQFSLKTVLVVLTLLCLGPGGYVAYEQAKARKHKAAVEAIEKFGGKVEFDQTVPVRSATMRQILGNESFGNVRSVIFDGTQVSDAGLVHLAELRGLKELWLGDTPVTDADLVHLAGLTKLESLYLQETQVSDAGLVHLAGLKGLRELWLKDSLMTDAGLVHLADLKSLEILSLSETRVTDAGLVHLAGLKGLKQLWIDKTQVTDAGLVHLAGLNSLEYLSCFDTQVTNAGVAKLEMALPNCRAYGGPAGEEERPVLRWQLNGIKRKPAP
jgi:hypothetical protein